MSGGLRSVCGVHVLECDSHNNKVVAWQYPECDRDLGAVMLARWSPHATEKDLVRVSRFRRNWLYTATLNIATPVELTQKGDVETAPDAAPEIAARFPKVSAVAVCVVSDTFAPKCFQALSDALLSLYIADGNPLRLLRWFVTTTLLSSPPHRCLYCSQMCFFACLFQLSCRFLQGRVQGRREDRLLCCGAHRRRQPEHPWHLWHQGPRHCAGRGGHPYLLRTHDEEACRRVRADGVRSPRHHPGSPTLGRASCPWMVLSACVALRDWCSGRD